MPVNGWIEDRDREAKVGACISVLGVWLDIFVSVWWLSVNGRIEDRDREAKVGAWFSFIGVWLGIFVSLGGVAVQGNFIVGRRNIMSRVN